MRRRAALRAPNLELISSFGQCYTAPSAVVCIFHHIAFCDKRNAARIPARLVARQRAAVSRRGNVARRTVYANGFSRIAEPQRARRAERYGYKRAYYRYQ